MSQPDNSKQYVLVEAIQQSRVRYIVELDVDSPAHWALDTVVCNDAKLVSEEDLGETIVSHRVLPGGLAEAIAFAKNENPDVAGQWGDDMVIRNHITQIPDSN